MTSEFRRAHPRRTHIGDVFKDDLTGQLREVTAVWGASEYIAQKVDGRYYRFRHTGERNVMVMPARSKRGPTFVED